MMHQTVWVASDGMRGLVDKGRSVVFVVAVMMVVLLAGPVLLGHAEEGKDASAVVDKEQVAKDAREFAVYLPQREDDTPGCLKHGHCYSRAVPRVVSVGYRVAGEKQGDVRVEVVEHPLEYAYTVHDVLGTLLAMAKKWERNSCSEPASLDERIVCLASGIRVVKWGTSYLLWYESSSSSRGMVAWFHKSEKEITTVMMNCSGLKGMPSKVIDDYLARYSSDVRPETLKYDEWVSSEAKKWIDLIRSVGTDAERGQMLVGAGQIALRQYACRDSQFMKTMMVLMKKDATAEEVGAEIEELVKRIEAWAATRKTEAEGKAGK